MADNGCGKNVHPVSLWRRNLKMLESGLNTTSPSLNLNFCISVANSALRWINSIHMLVTGSRSNLWCWWGFFVFRTWLLVLGVVLNEFFFTWPCWGTEWSYCYVWHEFSFFFFFFFPERKIRNHCKQVADVNKVFFNVLCKLALSSGVLCLETHADG